MTGKFIENFEAMFTSLKILGYMPFFTFDNINIRLFKERNDQQQHLFLQWYQINIKKYEITGIGTEILYSDNSIMTEKVKKRKRRQRDCNSLELTRFQISLLQHSQPFRSSPKNCDSVNK